MMTFDRMRVTGDTNDLALNQTFYLLYAFDGTVDSINPLSFSQHTTQGVFGQHYFCGPEMCAGMYL